MASDTIKALQRRLKAQGFYDGPIDGVKGEGTRTAQEALKAHQENQTLQREADAKKAESAAQQAAADAKKAAAEAKAREAETRALEAELKSKKEERDSDPFNRAYKLLLNTVAPIGGLAAGHMLAKHIDRRHQASMAARATQANVLAAEARKVPGGKLSSRRLAAIDRTAKGLRLNKVTGPLGLGTAGVLALESAMLRFVVAPSAGSDEAKELINAAATGAAFAATALVGERLVQNATPKTLPNARAVAAINMAAAGVTPPADPSGKPKKKKPGPKPKGGGPKPTKGGPKGAGGLARVVVPAIAGVAAYTAFSKSVQAGESTETAISRGAKEAGIVTANILTGGAPRIFSERRSEGKSVARSGSEAVVRGVAALATIGLTEAAGPDTIKAIREGGTATKEGREAITRAVENTGFVLSAGLSSVIPKLGRLIVGPVPEGGFKPTKSAKERRAEIRRKRGLNDGQRADLRAASMKIKAGRVAARGQEHVSDGFVDPHTRRVNGKTVKVEGHQRKPSAKRMARALSN